MFNRDAEHNNEIEAENLTKIYQIRSEHDSDLLKSVYSNGKLISWSLSGSELLVWSYSINGKTHDDYKKERGQDGEYNGHFSNSGITLKAGSKLSEAQKLAIEKIIMGYINL